MQLCPMEGNFLLYIYIYIFIYIKNYFCACSSDSSRKAVRSTDQKIAVKNGLYIPKVLDMI